MSGLYITPDKTVRIKQMRCDMATSEPLKVLWVDFVTIVNFQPD